MALQHVLPTREKEGETRMTSNWSIFKYHRDEQFALVIATPWFGVELYGHFLDCVLRRFITGWRFNWKRHPAAHLGGYPFLETIQRIHVEDPPFFRRYHA